MRLHVILGAAALTSAIGLSLSNSYATSEVELKKANVEILRLEKVIDGKVTSKISLFSNEMRPNVMSIYDNWRLEIDGKEVDVPAKLLAKVGRGRNGYSHEHFTGGIKYSKPSIMCMMGGPAIGHILHVRYLTYDKNSVKVLKNEMLPVYSEAGNCLFADYYSPNKIEAEKSAIRTITSLQTIKGMLDSSQQ